MKIPHYSMGQHEPFVPYRILLVVASGLAALTLLLHGSALQGGWRFDDPLILRYILEHPDVTGYFLSPEQWRASGFPFFTPWLILDYWLDLKLFGFKPAMFFAHHLLIIWLAALLTFMLLYRRVGAFLSGMAAALFLSGAPVAIISQQIMTRHYATGLVFAILSILFWLRAREGATRIAPALSAGFYLLAMLNKEIFAPLPLVLFFLQSGTLKSRIVAMYPLALSAVIFVLWRSAMLGKVVGGYAGFDAARELPASLIILPQTFFGSGVAALAALLSVAGWALYASRRHAPLILAVLAALLLPFLAIHASLHPVVLRFAFLPWWGCCVLLTLGLATIRHSARCKNPLTSYTSKAHLLTVLALLVVIAPTLDKRQDSARALAVIADTYDVEGRFMWSKGNDVSLVPLGDLAGAGSFGYGITALKFRHLGEGAPVAVPFSEATVKLHAPLPVYVYDPDCRCMQIALHTDSAASENDGWQANMPMQIRMDRSRNGLTWQIHAPPGSACFLVFRTINLSLQAPCSGGISYDTPPWLKGKFTLVVRAPGNRWNASSLLTFPEKSAILAWDSSME